MPTADPFQLLDEPQEWSAFSRLIDATADLWESQVVVGGMHCAACSVTVEDVLRQVPGVQGASVSASGQRATVQWLAGRVLPSGWMGAVVGSGYQVVPANDAFANTQRKAQNRKALWRWLVAGLCMMQVMMYAYPAYTARAGDLSAEMEALLRWASWVLTLPVVFFSCGGFFRSAWNDVTHRRIGMDLPVALGIAVTFAVSTAGTFEPDGIFGREVYFDSLTMFVFFLLSGRWLELRLRARTAGALEAVMNRMPEGAERQAADGTLERVAVRRIGVGDLLRVQSGQSFAADGVVEQGASSVDEALLTGESRPLRREIGSEVLAGSFTLGATLWVRVQRVAGNTRYAQIVALMEAASATKPTLALLADRLAKPFLLGVMLSAAGAALWWWDRDPERALMVAVSVLVVTCPCALSLATPVAMLAAAGRLARGGVLVQHLQSLESLAGVDRVVFDKTGTLTQDRQTIERILTPSGEVDYANITANQRQALLCALGLSQSSWHPVSRTLMADLSFKLALTDTDNAMVSDGTGFNSIREFAGQGLEGEGHLMGLSAQTPAPMNTPYRLGSLEFCASLSPPPFIPYGAQNAQVHLVGPSGWMASFVLSEDIRADAQKTLTQLHSMNNAVFLLSGDRQTAVTHVAQQIGLEAACVHSRMSPRDKLDFVATRQALGEVVATVGDGFNDLPAMAKTDVSIAFGKAIPITQSRADVVVLSEELWAVPLLLALSQKTMTIIRQNLLWAALYNFTCVPLAVMGYFPAWAAGLGMAASSLWVVFHASQLAKDRTLITPGPIPRRHATQRLDSVHP